MVIIRDKKTDQYVRIGTSGNNTSWTDDLQQARTFSESGGAKCLIGRLDKAKRYWDRVAPGRGPRYPAREDLEVLQVRLEVI